MLKKNKILQILLIAVSISNFSVVMQEVGRAWIMTNITNNAINVAMLQSSAMFAIFLFSLPAGLISDKFPVRRVLILSQVWLFIVSSALAAINIFEFATPAMLIGISFAAAAGSAFFGPAWQAALPQIAGPDALPAAVTLNGLSINTARSIAPAVGGAVMSIWGPEVVFILNVFSFGGVCAVLLLWPNPESSTAAAPQSVASGMRDSLRYVCASRPFRTTLGKTIFFAVPASAIWSLLPLLARRSGDPSEYSVMLTLTGAGAVISAIALPRLRSKFADGKLVLSSGLVLVFAQLMAAVPLTPALFIAAFAVGLGWLSGITILMIAAQATVPDWIRGRAISVYLLTFAAAMSVGGVVWGIIAEFMGGSIAMAIAGASQAISMIVFLNWTAPVSGDPRSRNAAHQWPAPALGSQPNPERGPVLVTVTYDVISDKRHEFLRAMLELGPLRRLEGSTNWALFESGRSSGRFVEINQLLTWGDHLRQRSRGSEAAVAVEAVVESTLYAGSRPEIEHWFGVEQGYSSEDKTWLHRLRHHI